jgi:hypothetical protein
MRKTTITAAALAMSASLAGLAYAAAPDGRSTDDSSVVTTFSPASESSTSSSSSSTAPEISPSVSPTTGDDHGGDRGGHGADDTITPTPAMPTEHQRYDGSDDGPGQDVGDDHGGDRGGHGSDDGPGHDVGDDHGSGGHGSDD